MTRAEQKAKEAYPIHPMEILPEEDENGKILNFDEWLDDFRLFIQSFSLNKGYQEGYEQAEKDYALTWKDIESIVLLTDEIARFSWFYNNKLQGQELYEEVLKKFNERK